MLLKVDFSLMFEMDLYVYIDSLSRVWFLEKPSWSGWFIKYIAVLVHIIPLSLTYPLSAAYTTDEIEDKTKSLRESAKYAVGDDASALDVSLALHYIQYYMFAYCDVLVKLCLFET